MSLRTPKRECPHVQTLGGEQDGPGSDADAAFMMQGDSEVKRSRLKFSKFQLGPVKGWVSSTVNEKVNGMPTVVSPMLCPCARRACFAIMHGITQSVDGAVSFGMRLLVDSN